MTGYRVNLKLCHKPDVLGWRGHMEFASDALGFTVFVHNDFK